MNWLPILTNQGLSWRFPLSDSSHAAIVDALLTDQANQRVAKIKSTLDDDPVLTLWSVLSANQHNPIVFRSTVEVAEWLTVFALDVLHWTDEELSVAIEVPPTSIDQFSKLIERGLHRSLLLASLARASQRAPESVFLIGLLHLSHEWMRCCCVNKSDDKEILLPDWLSEALSDVDQLKESEDYRLQSQDLAQRWSMSIPSIGFSLPLLIRKLARLKELESDFQYNLQREKLGAMKELAYGASHEVNNPLANISTRAQTLLRDETDPVRRRKLTTINDQAFRAHEMISNLMHFARPPRVRSETMDLIGLINETIAELEDEAKSQNTELIDASQTRALNLSADRSQLKTAIGTLITNSLEALRSGGRVEVSVRESASQVAIDKKYIEITVVDNGPGIADDVKRHIFDPFYSGREAGRGLGFGLCRCWSIVEQHGGRIDVQSQPGHGAKFIIRLPSHLPMAANGPAVAIN